MRPMFAPLVPASSVTFVSKASIDSGVVQSYGLRKRVEPVINCRNIGKRDMKFNDTKPKMKVDPERYTVEADGEICVAEPAETLPLTQQYFVY